MLRSLLRIQIYFKALTKQQAAKRAELIKHNSINYGFYLNLHPDPNKTYDGFAEISFQLTKNLHHNDLFLDFQGKTVKDIFVNNHRVPQNAYVESEGKIYLPFDLLHKKGRQNYVTVSYNNNYDKDGSGCVSFTDVDSMQYLYTQFQPFMANRVFPLFDQPDLKAPMQLSVACPRTWQTVISNEFIKEQFDQIDKKVDFNHLIYQVLANSKQIHNYERQQLKHFIREVPQNYHTTIFNQTKLLSTYLYCFVVGPYKKFPILQTYRSIPMNLYCIQSLYPHLIKLQPFISQITNKSMQFFEHYFHYPYPFSKYDQIFAHQYKWGAMQNAGIVTFNDQYLFKQDVSTQRKLSLANTIAHELAHHWFGNLVTMKWWDDLWLNQSFAEYISHYCLEKIKDQVQTLKYQSAMTAFYGRKAWGYAEDKLQTTHPIRGQVHNTTQADSIFDGITYAKGAATMKQLMFLIGQDRFSQALRQYFHEFQYKNAVLDDLLNHLNRIGSAHLPTTMETWKQSWLQSAGLNQIQCFWSPAQYEKTNEIMIKQTAYLAKFPTLRNHTIQIAFIYQQQPGNLKVKYMQVTLKPQQYTRIKCQLPTPKAIFLNFRDLSFVKTVIDEYSLKYLRNNLRYIRNCQDGLLLSTMIWRNFHEMVTQANISSRQYVDLCLRNLFFEKTDSIVQQQLSLIFQAIRAYTPGAYREKMFDQVFQACYNELINFSKLSSGKQMQSQNRILILKNKIINFADSQEAKKKLLNWMNGQTLQLKSGAFQLKGKQQWRSLTKVFTMKSLKKKQKWELFEYQKMNDSSDDMVNFKYTLTALLATQQQMKVLYQQYLNPKTNLSITYLSSSMSGFNHSIHYQEIAKHYLLHYFNDLVQAVNTLPSSQAQLFLTHMDPIIDNKHSDISIKIYEFKRILSQIKDFKLHRIVKKKIETLQRRNKAYEKFEKCL